MKTIQVLAECPCTNGDLTIQELEGPIYGGHFVCTHCGARKPARVVNGKSFISTFRALAEEVHETARSKGWWTDREMLIQLAEKHSKRLGEFANKVIGALGIALEHSELSEGLEGMRKDLKDDKIPEFTMEEAEAADVIIRIMDRGVKRKLRIAEAIVAKIEMNKGREHLHGGKSF